MTALPVPRPIPVHMESEQPLNIVIVVTYAHPYIGSGLGVVAKCQAEYLASQGHTVTLISSNIPQTSHTFVLNGVNHIKVPAAALLERYHIPVPLLFFTTSALRAIKNADIVHVHDVLYPSSFVAAFLAKSQKKRVILTQHVPHVEYKNILINMIEKFCFSTLGLATLWASDAAIVLNSSVHTWIGKYKDSVHLLSNGVDFKVFHTPTEQEKQDIRKQYNLPPDKFIVLFVGRFVPKKGFDILYNAKDSSYLLVFVGGGIIPEHIVSDDSVRIMGPLPQEELALMYKASDAFILPSYGEGFPLSIQEAMATGLPVITSTHNRFDQMDNTSLITYIDITEAAITSAIKKIQFNPKLQREMSQYSSRIARDNYSWEKNCTKLVAVYRQKTVVENKREMKRSSNPSRTMIG